MSSEKLDPESRYGNYTILDPYSNEIDLFNAFMAMKDNMKESLPKEMRGKVEYFLSWKYTP